MKLSKKAAKAAETLGIFSPQGLATSCDMLLELSRAAARYAAGEFFEPIMERLSAIPDDVKLTFIESAGQKNDDRFAISMEVYADEKTMRQILEAFQLGDFEEALADEYLTDQTDSIHGSFYEYAPYENNDFRILMDHVGVLFEPLAETITTFGELRWAVQGACKPLGVEL